MLCVQVRTKMCDTELNRPASGRLTVHCRGRDGAGKAQGAKAEAARNAACAQGGVYWIGTEATLLPRRHANLVFLHALMKLVTTVLKWSYAQAEADVTSKHLEAAAELLTLRRDRIRMIDAENNRLKEDEQEKQESGEEQKKPKPKRRKAKELEKQSSSDEPENPSPK